MSHMAVTRTVFTDRELLIAALEKQGFRRNQIEVHDRPVTLYGYDGRPRPEKGEIVVRRQFVGSASNDLAFRRGADGAYVAIISDYDRNTQYGRKWQHGLAEHYMTGKALQTLERKGLRGEVSRNTGTGKLEVRAKVSLRR